ATARRGLLADAGNGARRDEPRRAHLERLALGDAVGGGLESLVRPALTAPRPGPRPGSSGAVPSLLPSEVDTAIFAHHGHSLARHRPRHVERRGRGGAGEPD